MKKGQIWIETVLYTLIGLALIGIVLALATPKINESKDRLVVEQSIDSLNVFDEKIGEVLDRGAGNIRKIDVFTLRRGELTVDGENDVIALYVGELERPYSEPGIVVDVGRMSILSEEGRKESSVILWLNYSGVFNLTYNGNDESEAFAKTSRPYSFSIENKGLGEGLTVVDVRENS